MSIEPTFTPYRAVQAEGARIGLLVCELCGGAIVIDTHDDPAFDPVELHKRWHRSLEAMHGWAQTASGQAPVTVRRAT